MCAGEIQQLVVKALIAVQPALAHSYTSCLPSTEAHPFSCFELLGLDLLIDAHGQPWLIEVHRAQLASSCLMPQLTLSTPSQALNCAHLTWVLRG